MRKTSLIPAVVLLAAAAVTAAPQRAPSVFESSINPAPRGKIDQLVLGRLKRLGIEPAKVCSDAVFVRRVYLDAIGTLPSEEEARTFRRGTR